MGDRKTNRNPFNAMTNEEYHAGPGISSSKLHLLDESERHLEMAKLFNLESDSMDFGTLVHTLVVEPEKENDYAVMPKIDGRTTAGKSEKLDWIEDNEGKIIIDEADYNRASRMAGNVLAIAGGLVTLGVKEQSYFVEEDGLLLKCRPDNYIEQHGIVVDLRYIANILMKYIDDEVFKTSEEVSGG
jgi:exodeoxyribonuclease VIII